MGCWDVYCPICGLACWNNLRDYEGDLLKKKEVKELDWLNKCYFMTANNLVIKGCEEIACNATFACGKNKYSSLIDIKELEYYKNYGLFIHEDCHKYIKKEYNITLKLSDFYFKGFIDNKPMVYVNYGDIKKYWLQFFDVYRCLEDGNLWMLLSPLKSTRNQKRIKKIFNQLKIKSDRSGPSISASFYKNGTIKIGNDGYFWIIKGGKWVKINEKPILEIEKRENQLKKIPQIGFQNNKPIFIKDFNDKEIIFIKKVSSNP